MSEHILSDEIKQTIEITVAQYMSRVMQESLEMQEAIRKQYQQTSEYMNIIAHSAGSLQPLQQIEAQKQVDLELAKQGIRPESELGLVMVGETPKLDVVDLHCVLQSIDDYRSGKISSLDDVVSRIQSAAR